MRMKKLTASHEEVIAAFIASLSCGLPVSSPIRHSLTLRIFASSATYATCPRVASAGRHHVSVCLRRAMLALVKRPLPLQQCAYFTPSRSAWLGTARPLPPSASPAAVEHAPLVSVRLFSPCFSWPSARPPCDPPSDIRSTLTSTRGSTCTPPGRQEAEPKARHLELELECIALVRCGPGSTNFLKF